MAVADLVSSFSAVAGAAVAGYVGRKALQRRLRRPLRADLLLALLAARLSALAYVTSERELTSGLSAPALAMDAPSGFEVLYFRGQRARSRDATFHPQWYLARADSPPWVGPWVGSHRPNGAHKADAASKVVYLVFRGTFSASDVMRDLCVEPEAHATGDRFHGGFLSGVRDDDVLRTQLGKAFEQTPGARLVVCGHSLGGSLAMTLVAAGLHMHPSAGPVTVVAIGSPPVCLGANPTASEPSELCTVLGGEAPAGNGRGARVRGQRERGARYLLVVNDCDVVPRLLGSPIPPGVERLLGAGGGRGMARHVEVLRTMGQYSHPAGTEGILLREGEAWSIPPPSRAAVLHMQEALSLSLLDDHATAGYVSRLELATALAEADREEADDREVG